MANTLKLVIVESPSKAKTIGQYLGKDFRVESSYGHIRDLPTSVLGVDVENNFEPKYKIMKKARERAEGLAKLARKAKELILATDPDREGEAIAWHLLHAINQLNKKNKKGAFVEGSENVKRIVFHEITKSAIMEAIAHPRPLDMHLVEAQQARRILDRLVGYNLSPFLWKKILRGLSAGRVQSVALRFVVVRERERDAFVPEQYFTIDAALRKHGSKKKEDIFVADLTKIDGVAIEKPGLKKQEEVTAIVRDLEKATYKVESVETRESLRNPLAPFTTSTLQQEAFSKLGFSAKVTMSLAQELYQGVTLQSGESVGLITYMRTDSTSLSEDALGKAAQFIVSHYGESYHEIRRFKTKSKLAQEAHEAIRPTDPNRTPESLEEVLGVRHYKLYKLIWGRFLASQMSSAKFDATKVIVTAQGSKVYTLSTSGYILRFPGFLKVYSGNEKDVVLPELKNQDVLDLEAIHHEEKFTQPPARYSEASLIKELEKHGIGRPSTYAPTISTIQERRYVEKDEAKRLKPTKIGILVTDLLEQHFASIVDYEFTANMEGELDEIAEGKKEWRNVMRAFYEPFHANLVKKYEEVQKIEMSEKSDEICEKCGKPMVIKYGRFGQFLSCSDFPQCRNAKALVVGTGIMCPKCGQGEIIERKTKKRGKVFYGCSAYPTCEFALWNKPTGEKCPKCESLLIEAGKRTVKCSNKECKYKVGAPEEEEE